jgi:hypothetical protein
LDGVGAECDRVDDDDDFCGSLGDAKDAANVKVVEARLLHVWSMFRSDWTTDAFSNLSRIEMVLITSLNG